MEGGEDETAPVDGEGEDGGGELGGGGATMMGTTAWLTLTGTVDSTSTLSEAPAAEGLLARIVAASSTDAATRALEAPPELIICGMVITAVSTTLPADSTRRLRMHAGSMQLSVCASEVISVVR